MDIRTNDNRILGGFRPRIVLALIFALAMIPGSLSLVLSEVQIFATAALVVLAALTFMTTRDILPICGIMIPCLFVLVSANNVALPALYFGFIFTFGATVYLCLGRRMLAVILSAALSYAAAALLLDPIRALTVLIPFALGMLAALMLCHFSLAGTVGTLSALILCISLSAFILLGGDLAATAESLRTYFFEYLMGIPEKLLVIEEGFAHTIAAYTVNILPGTVFAAISAVIYIACSLALSFLRSSGVLERLEEDKRSFSLSPVSGAVYISCFLLSAAFAIEGRDYEMAGAVTENILIALSLPFTVLGCRAVREFFMRKLFRRLPNKQKISNAAVALLFFMLPGGAIALFMSAGTAYSLMPVYRSVVKKMKESADSRN